LRFLIGVSDGSGSLSQPKRNSVYFLLSFV
jgi:hypothetical protein